VGRPGYPGHEGLGAMIRLRPWFRDAGSDTGIGRRDPVEARQWLDRQIIDDADAGQLRWYAAGLHEGTDWWRLDDAQVKDQLAAALDEGRLRTGQGAKVELRPLDQLQPVPLPALPAPASSPRAAPAPAPAAPVETTFAPNLDVAAQVAVLLQAARDGVPFCEECERAKRERAAPPSAPAALAEAPMTRNPEVDAQVAAQVAVLLQAAQDGAPFCEECERARGQRDEAIA